MATVTKDFRIKSGLVVEGTNGTINGSDIITEDKITGGTQSGISVTYVDGNVNFNVEDPDISISGDATGVTTMNNLGDTDVEITLNTVNEDVGSFGSETKIPTFTVNSKGLLTAAGEVDVATDLSIAGDTGTDTVSLLTDTLTFEGGNGITTTVTDNNVAIDIDSTVATLTDQQDLSNKRIIDTLYFTDGVTVADEGQIAVLSGSHDFEIKANYGDLTLKTMAADADVVISSDSGDIVLNADGSSYITSVSAGNEIATHAYVDNAISGLNWKDAVNLFATANVPLTGNTETVVVDGHAALDGTDDGYRLLLTNQTTDTENGIYVYADNGTTYTLTRSEDADAVAELVGAAVFVMEGTQYGSTSWVQANHYANSFDDLSWTQFSGAGSVTAGEGIAVDGLEISVDRTTVDTWYDPAGSAGTAEQNAKDYTDDLIGDATVDGTAGDTVTDRITSAVGTAVSDLTDYVDGFLDSSTGTTVEYIDEQDAATLLAANGYSDSLVAAGDATATPNYLALDINDISKQVAIQTSGYGNTEGTVYSFSKADYRSAKFLVRIAANSHTEVSEVLLTLDESDNVAITEYAVVGTNGSMGTISATVSGSNVNLVVTPVNTSGIRVIGTLF
jgi:hypothetical protein